MPRDHKEKYVMKCPICKSEVYRVDGLSTENEGLRPDYWCEECKVMFTCTKAGLYKRLKLIDYYAPDAKNRFIRELESCINTMQKLVKSIK